MRIIIILIFFLVIFILAVRPKTNNEVTVGNTRIKVNVASTPQKRAQGLSGTKSLKPYDGMIFLFDAPGTYPFWMKDMNYDLDFIFINNDSVVGLKKNVPSPHNNNGEIAVVKPPTITALIEVPSGFIDRYGIAVGQRVRYAL